MNPVEEIRNVTITIVGKDGTFQVLDYDGLKYDSQTELINDVVVDMNKYATLDWEKRNGTAKQE